MERKTKIHAEDNKQDLVITREFDLPVELLFKAYEDPEIIAEWMGTKVIQFESRRHGIWRIETSDKNGNVVMKANGVHHEFVPNEKITRTFEMEGTPFPVQLEFLEFEKLTDDTSKLTMQIVFRSVHFRDELLKLPFAMGINWAHNRLQEVLIKRK